MRKYNTYTLFQNCMPDSINLMFREAKIYKDTPITRPQISDIVDSIVKFNE